MRLPFMQLESDFLAHGAQELAHLARCSPAQAIGHVALLRAWAVSHATDDAPPDGWVGGDAAERRVEAAAQWTGEAGALLLALVDAGQVRREAGGVRVLHLEPYVRAWEQNRAAKERMRNRRERSANTSERTATADVTGANTGSDAVERSAKFAEQTQTQTQKKEEKPSAGAGAPPEAGDEVQPPSPQPTPGKPSRPRKPAEGEHHELWRALEAEYQRVMGHPYASGNQGADAAAVKWLREGSKATPEEAVRRWGNLLTASRTGFPTVTGFRSLQQHWNTAEATGKVRPRGGNGWAAPAISSLDAFDRDIPGGRSE